MKNTFKNILFIILLLANFSCTPSAPYEIKSPCVSVDGQSDTQAINPCVRRPVNMVYAIT